ncbi:hypothetical protein CGC21_2775 [Leishmania donovani]|nr:hypothetical protein CGC21_2775 [Leishmania donovani]
MARSRAAPRASGGSSHHAAASPPPKKAEPLHQSTPHAHPQQPNGVTNIYAPTQPAEAQQLAQAAQQEGHVCTPQLVGYSKCLEANPESADSCKWAWDYFTQCQREHPMQPPQ